MRRSICFALLSLLGHSFVSVFAAEPPANIAFERDFERDIKPFLKRYCNDCHGREKQEGKLDLSGFTSAAAVVKQHGVWELVLERLEAGEMPPAKAPRKPDQKERQAIVEWIRLLNETEAQRNAGDPGAVLARRLSNAEFDYTIRDLTAVDIRPTKEFPVDPANEAGFDNSGESLAMSPALLKKYLAAARHVADHLVLKPKGFVFAPHPAVTETDRDKFCVQRIVDFYQRHQIDYADYFLAAWNYQHREQFGLPNAPLEQFATATAWSTRSLPQGRKSGTARTELPLSAKYLALIWTALNEKVDSGPMAELQSEWKSLAAPNSINGTVETPESVRRGCEQMRELVIKRRKELDRKVEKLHIKGNSDGSQPLILWWNRQIAAQRMSFTGDGKDPAQDAVNAQFCRIFPNTFAVTSRGHYADAKLGAEVRLLTAGFHLMQGYFRDDTPLCELVLTEAEKRELDTLWQELDFVTLVPFRQYKDFLFFERAEPPRFAGGAEFDFARPEDKDVTSESKLQRMSEAYLAKVKKHDASPAAIEAVETYFSKMSRDFRWVENAHRVAEQSHRDDLVTFTERAYRRPLTSTERESLLTFYSNLRDKDGLNHEDAIRDCVVSVLMSPHFCYRFDLKSTTAQIEPLSDYALASRLSYFLWSSMPDNELLAHAAAGDLHEPAVLLGQAHRMLKDERIRGLATEFAGNWLEFRNFGEHNSVDRERFSTFTNELRQAMFEEPVRFFADVASRDRSVLDFLYADDTFVNPLLARHYGITHPTEGTDDWVRVSNLEPQGRGGLLTMSVFLTKNSPGLRTSPVKRGYWVVRRLLGEHIPAPPPDVPELPKDESKLGDLTLVQVLAKHREHQSCAVCHVRFDSVGLVFEGYGPIGDRREKDLGGHPVSTEAVFPNGTTGEGLAGLKRYLHEHREMDFVDNLSRKMLVYALNRSLMPSDKLTIERMRADLEARGHRFSSLVDSIITSPQFLNKRGEAPADAVK